MLEHYFILAFLAGLANKMHDDLSDNSLLSTFKTPVVMEWLKGVHYVFFTALSLQKPVFFMLLFAMFGFSSLADPNAWTGAYETAVPFALGLIYLLLDYSQLSTLSFYDVFILPAILSTNILEPLVLPQEFSILKLIVRVHILGALLCIILLPMFSDTVKYICMYYTGYFLGSVVSQYYCLLKTKPKKKRRHRFKQKIETYSKHLFK
jgi:hypothetical protein